MRVIVVIVVLCEMRSGIILLRNSSNRNTNTSYDSHSNGLHSNNLVIIVLIAIAFSILPLCAVGAFVVAGYSEALAARWTFRKSLGPKP